MPVCEQTRTKRKHHGARAHPVPLAAARTIYRNIARQYLFRKLIGGNSDDNEENGRREERLPRRRRGRRG